MKKIKLIALAILLLLLPLSAIAANSIHYSKDRKTVTLSVIDSDVTWLTIWPEYPDGVRIFSIDFHPGATDDLCTLEDYEFNDVKHFFSKCADTYDDRTKGKPPGLKIKFQLDYDDTDGNWTAAYTSGCSLTIVLWPNQ